MSKGAFVNGPITKLLSNSDLTNPETSSGHFVVESRFLHSKTFSGKDDTPVKNPLRNPLINEFTKYLSGCLCSSHANLSTLIYVVACINTLSLSSHIFACLVVFGTPFVEGLI